MLKKREKLGVVGPNGLHPVISAPEIPRRRMSLYYAL